ncbi:MAG TPA: tRNA preQ1(34) S-adenosylmethionine ribosyltransferase-isomerase QueA [Longimicrobiales bacterium]|nr:tRNA preQ1(34) S-adenosylmethionine ribosyltransferase-isomerase QueA [Longimicrobiales bacterium]
MSSPDYPTSAFDYDLPHRLIARHPAPRRDQSRLLVLERATGAIAHRRFHDLGRLIPPGDVLVLNETRVLPARLLGRRAGGGTAEVLLLRELSAEERTWEALVRPGGRLRPGRTVQVAEDFAVEVGDVLPYGVRRVRLLTALPVRAALERYGRMPLPPYIDREVERADAERYQTVFARHEGSVAAPTAGLHFTPALLGELERRGVHIVRILLHVGMGTFRPVEVEDPDAHVMHEEWYQVPADAAVAIAAVRAAGGRLWAVGTTVARTLESVADEAGHVQAATGWTRLFIRPGYRWRAVDRLITNFHLPRSTLLMLVAAFGGYQTVMTAYREAIDREYRFYSYGDAMVLL